MSRRGRRPGTLNGQGEVQWEPKTWKPLYDQMVVLAAAGHKNTEIAKILKCHSVSVGLILRSKQGKEALAKQTKNSVAARQEKIDEIQDLALRRVKDALADDELASLVPLKVADRALRVLPSITQPKQKEAPANQQVNSQVINNTKTVTKAMNILVTDPTIASRVLEGLDKLKEIKQIHG